LKMSSLPILALKSPSKIFIGCLGIYQIPVPVLLRICLLYHQCCPLLGHEHLEHDITPVTS
jgi:hypothetical protein